MKLDNHTTHFWFDPNPSKDDRTGRYDVAVARWGWHHAGRGRCLGVPASCGRWDADAGGGVRHVQGSLPEIEKKLAKINPKDVEQALLERIRTDYKELPFPEFQEKYNL